MTAPHFTFHHEWVLDAPREAVVAALADPEGYPRWWAQVRGVERLDETSGRARIRSALPMTLHLVLTREIEDREGGYLRVRLDGDLEGWAGWSIVALRDGRGRPPGPEEQGRQRPKRLEGQGASRATFDQEVRVASRLSRAATLAPVVLRANHAWMMRQGRSGLARYLTRCR